MKNVNAWFQQWSQLGEYPYATNIFYQLIYPNTIDTFRGKSVLNIGCGSGVETREIAQVARRVVAVDLYTTEILKEKLKLPNIEIIRGDAAELSLAETFDVVVALGVLHHTQDPYKSFLNIQRYVCSGGKLILHLYAKENSFFLKIFDLARRPVVSSAFFKKRLLFLSKAIAICFIPIIHLVRFLGAKNYQLAYVSHLAEMDFMSIVAVVYDKLNAPVVHYVSRREIESWCLKNNFSSFKLHSYYNIAWLVTAVKG